MSSFPRPFATYTLLRELGRGGAGVVYEARHHDAPDRPLALKLLLSDDPTTRARFEREALLLASLQHPNVVRVHSFDRAPQGPYFVTELVQGHTLQHHRELQPLPTPRLLQLAITLCHAVEALHQHQLLHRDLKPDNVMVRPDGSPVLLDFGLARDVGGQRLTQTGAFMGTPAYMAPEQAHDAARVDPRADVYALGGILHFLVHGEPPNTSGRRPRAHDRALQSVCQRALADDPDRRYPTAAALREDLQRLAAGQPPSSLPRRRLPVALAAGASLGLLLLLALTLPSAAVPNDPAPADTPTTPAPDPAPAPDARPPVKARRLVWSHHPNLAAEHLRRTRFAFLTNTHILTQAVYEDFSTTPPTAQALIATWALDDLSNPLSTHLFHGLCLEPQTLHTSTGPLGVVHVRSFMNPTPAPASLGGSIVDLDERILVRSLSQPPDAPWQTIYTTDTSVVEVHSTGDTLLLSHLPHHEPDQFRSHQGTPLLTLAPEVWARFPKTGADADHGRLFLLDGPPLPKEDASWVPLDLSTPRSGKIWEVRAHDDHLLVRVGPWGNRPGAHLEIWNRSSRTLAFCSSETSNLLASAAFTPTGLLVGNRTFQLRHLSNALLDLDNPDPYHLHHRDFLSLGDVCLNPLVSSGDSLVNRSLPDIARDVVALDEHAFTGTGTDRKDALLTVWDLRTSPPTAILNVPLDDEVHQLQFSPDQRTLGVEFRHDNPILLPTRALLRLARSTDHADLEQLLALEDR